MESIVGGPGVTAGQYRGIGCAQAHGSPAAEVTAGRHSVSWIARPWRRVLIADGPDRGTWLQGLVSQDVKDIPTAQSRHALVLTLKGKVQTDLLVHSTEGSYWLELDQPECESTREALDRYLFREQVELTAAEVGTSVFTLVGPQSAQLIQRSFPMVSAPAADLQAISVPVADGHVRVTAQLWSTGLVFDVMGPSGPLQAAWDACAFHGAALGGCAGGLDAWEVLRVRAGWPAFGVDYDGTTLPPEAGLDPRALSYTKGCYVGQEVIARLHAQGHVNRLLRRLEFREKIEETPGRSTKLWTADREVGWITSAVIDPSDGTAHGMGYVRRDHALDGTELAFETPHGRVAVIVRE